MNDLYIARKISELPKEPNTYYTFWLEPGSQQIIILGADIYDPETRQFEVWDDESEKGRYTQPDGWLQPTTLENLIAENPQAVDKIFEAARTKSRKFDANGMAYWGDTFKTAQDYINSLKDEPKRNESLTNFKKAKKGIARTDDLE